MIASKLAEELSVKSQKLKLKHPTRPAGLDARTWGSIKPVLWASRNAQQQTGRFKYDSYLIAVYRTRKEWKANGISKRMSRRVAKHFGTARRKETNPIRTLIDASFPDLDPKQKSRWSRALEFAVITKVLPKDLSKLFGKYGGIAGCARFAARYGPKKQREGWADPPAVRLARRGQASDSWAPAPDRPPPQPKYLTLHLLTEERCGTPPISDRG